MTITENDSKSNQLSQAEQRLIEEHRKVIRTQTRAHDFYRVSVILAAEWQAYAMVEGYHLTHSVFIDNFDFHSRLERLNDDLNLDGRIDDVKPMYFRLAVEKILDAGSTFTNALFQLD